MKRFYFEFWIEKEKYVFAWIAFRISVRWICFVIYMQIKISSDDGLQRQQLHDNLFPTESNTIESMNNQQILLGKFDTICDRKWEIIFHLSTHSESQVACLLGILDNTLHKAIWENAQANVWYVELVTYKWKWNKLISNKHFNEPMKCIASLRRSPFLFYFWLDLALPCFIHSSASNKKKKQRYPEKLMK